MCASSSPSSLSRSWRGWLICLVLLCGPASFCFSRSFDPAATYKVTGAELIQLEQDLLTAKTELETLRTKNAQLLTDSESKAQALTELQKQLTTVSQSWTESKNETLAREFWVGAGGVAVGVLAGIVLTLYLTN